MNRFANFARSQLAAYLHANGTELTVQNAELFPEGSFTAVIWGNGFASPADDPNREIVLAQKTESTISVERGRESTSAKDWNTGSMMANVVTAEMLNTFASARSFRVVTDSGSVIDPFDCTVAISFSKANQSISCVLPDAALYSGDVLTIINSGTEPSQYAVIIAAEGDTIGLNGITQTTLGSACTVKLAVIGGIWRIIGTGIFSPHSFQTFTTSGPVFSYGSAVYADASESPLYLYIQQNSAMTNVPVPVIKTDETDNSVFIYDTANKLLAELKEEGGSFWFMQTAYGGIVNLTPESGGSSGTGGTASVTGYYSLPSGISYIFADASVGYAYVSMGSASEHAGQSVTVIRTDTNSNPVMIGDIETSEIMLEAEGSFRTYVSSGTKWFRTA